MDGVEGEEEEEKGKEKEKGKKTKKGTASGAFPDFLGSMDSQRPSRAAGCSARRNHEQS